MAVSKCRKRRTADPGGIQLAAAVAADDRQAAAPTRAREGGGPISTKRFCKSVSCFDNTTSILRSPPVREQALVRTERPQPFVRSSLFVVFERHELLHGTALGGDTGANTAQDVAGWMMHRHLCQCTVLLPSNAAAAE
jgi:hypothetical protein